MFLMWSLIFLSCLNIFSNSLLKRIRMRSQACYVSTYFSSDVFELNALSKSTQHLCLQSSETVSFITKDYINDLMLNFKRGETIPKRTVITILNEFISLMRPLQIIQHINIPRNGSINVLGDIHGQFDDLYHVFELFGGLPSANNIYVFNGDFIDRGDKSFECMTVLMVLKLLHPEYIHLNRGNHEDMYCSSRYGFQEELLHKYDDYGVFQLFNEAFEMLPLVTIIEEKLFVVHGGIPSPTLSLAAIGSINKPLNLTSAPHDHLAMDLLWSDPQIGLGLRDSSRGAGKRFGPDVTASFLENNQLDLLIRSHQPRVDGYEIEHAGKCITVFSAPDSVFRTVDGKVVGNLGAGIKITKDPNIQYEFITFSAIQKSTSKS